MTFQKGQSGNPGGRATGYKAFRQTASKHMDTAGVRSLIDMAGGDGEDRRFALRLLAEYAYGKPQQQVSLESTSAIQVSVSFDRADA